MVTVGPQRVTEKDTEKDREGGHGSTSQLNLTISLPRESGFCHLCPPFRKTQNQLDGQTVFNRQESYLDMNTEGGEALQTGYHDLCDKIKSPRPCQMLPVAVQPAFTKTQGPHELS